MEPKTKQQEVCVCVRKRGNVIYILFTSFLVLFLFFGDAFSLLRERNEEDVKITSPGLLIVLNGVSPFTQNSRGEMYTCFSPSSSLLFLFLFYSFLSHIQLIAFLSPPLPFNPSLRMEWGLPFPSSNVTFLAPVVVPSLTLSIILPLS